MEIITVSGLTKFYGQVRGIEDVSFTVSAGEIFGFIGPNGAGKSTTIRLLLGLISPTRGSARIFGHDVFRHGPEIRREIGYLPAEVFYYEGMKVIDLLTYAASFYPGDHRDRIHELAEYMELDLNRRIEDLSLGNKKKVGIVQGLLHKPRLVFLDEPTSGLDPLMQRKFFTLIQRENRERGLTVFFSSHILSEVQRLCDRVGIVRNGQIVEIAHIKDLRQRTYKRVRVLGPALQAERFHFPGVADLRSENGSLHFLFQGDVNHLLQRLAAEKVQDVLIEEPDLEEIFMHYYE